MYARVSTDKDEQFTSYEAQVDYYTNYIKQHKEWCFIKVYTDEGISGLNTKKREGFNEMIRDALNGKIDLIITKSVSRFARNAVDSLSTIRRLKEKGIEIYFEKENIWTFDGKGELLITRKEDIKRTKIAFKWIGAVSGLLDIILIILSVGKSVFNKILPIDEKLISNKLL